MDRGAWWATQSMGSQRVGNKTERLNNKNMASVEHLFQGRTGFPVDPHPVSISSFDLFAPHA